MPKTSHWRWVNRARRWNEYAGQLSVWETLRASGRISNELAVAIESEFLYYYNGAQRR